LEIWALRFESMLPAVYSASDGGGTKKKRKAMGKAR